jgi:hypothetical protein
MATQFDVNSPLSSPQWAGYPLGGGLGVRVSVAMTTLDSCRYLPCQSALGEGLGVRTHAGVGNDIHSGNGLRMSKMSASSSSVIPVRSRT